MQHETNTNKRIIGKGKKHRLAPRQKPMTAMEKWEEHNKTMNAIHKLAYMQFFPGDLKQILQEIYTFAREYEKEYPPELQTLSLDGPLTDLDFLKAASPGFTTYAELTGYGGNCTGTIVGSHHNEHIQKLRNNAKRIMWLGYKFEAIDFRDKNAILIMEFIKRTEPK